MLEVLERSGYVNPVTAASTRLKTRRLIRRLALTERDAIVLTGMMRQILWKLTEGSSDVQDRNPSGTVAAAG
jgi:tRNA C32,U32 (ribose-2'-O)-methylase TrmJ